MKNFYPKTILLFIFLLMGSFGLKSHFENKLPVEIDPSLKRNLLLTPELIEAYNVKLNEILKKHDFKGNIVLMLEGKVIFQESFGYANIGKKLKNEAQTVFQLASVSKQFTAMGIALLKNKGVLSYDDYVKKYIPEFPYDNITIKHLLNHTSGLQNYVWLIDNKWNKNRMPDNEDLIDLIVENKLPLNFPPGQKFKYSNTGYAFLASVIERVSGEKFGDFIKEHIFDTLGMTNSFVFNKDMFDTLPGVALGYVKRGGKLIHYENDNNDGIVGDKGIYSSVEDLLKWDAALYGDLLLPKEEIDTLFIKNKTLKGDTVFYGFGWRLPKTDYPQMVYHNGWWHGYRATLRRYVGNKNTLIILNNTNQNIFPLINEIETILYPEIATESEEVVE